MDGHVPGGHLGPELPAHGPEAHAPRNPSISPASSKRPTARCPPARMTYAEYIRTGRGVGRGARFGNGTTVMHDPQPAALNGPSPPDGSAQSSGAAPKPFIRWLAVGLALLGWWVSLDLARLGYGAGASNPLLAAQCGVDSDPGAGCRSALGSRWASVPLSKGPGSARLPMAAFGMGYFALVALWYALAGPPTRDRRHAHAFIGLVVLIGCSQSLYLTRVMATELRAWYAGCLAVHAINALLLLLTLAAYPWTRKGPAPGTANPSPRLALAAAVSGLLAFALHLAFSLALVSIDAVGRMQKAYAQIVNDPQFAVWQYSRSPRVAARLDEGGTAVGPPDAPHTAVLFADFECPRCKAAHDMLTQAARSHGGKLRVIYRHYPLDRACNSVAERSLHAFSCQAAEAAEAVKIVGGAEAFVSFQRMLFEDQEFVGGGDLLALATRVGASETALQKALDSGLARDAVAADVALGQQLGIQTVPTLYLDGRRLEFWGAAEIWDALLRGAEGSNVQGAEGSRVPGVEGEASITP